MYKGNIIPSKYVNNSLSFGHNIDANLYHVCKSKIYHRSYCFDIICNNAVYPFPFFIDFFFFHLSSMTPNTDAFVHITPNKLANIWLTSFHFA